MDVIDSFKRMITNKQHKTLSFMKGRFLLTVLILGLAFDGLCQETIHKSVKYPDNYKAEIDLIYTRVDGWEGRMDLYTNPVSKEPTPVVVNIHGGGWNHGSKESQTGFKYFFKEGFAVANIEYRLVDVSPAPAAIEDIRCALIYLYQHADALNIDTNKIVIMGSSAGAHLALMAGLLANDKRFDTNCEYDTNIKVAAIIDKYAPTDLTSVVQGSIKRWLGDLCSWYKGFSSSIRTISYAL